MTSLDEQDLEWYVTAQDVRKGPAGGGLVPDSEAHARRSGSRVTACGQVASSWPQLGHQHFPAYTVPSCRECVKTVARSRVALLHSRTLQPTW
ncbi:hypothetical protein BH11ACT8_BH11ACT8_00700 [soil metagenome]